MNIELSSKTISDAEIEKMQSEVLAHIAAEAEFHSEQLEKAKDEIWRLRAAVTFAYTKLSEYANQTNWERPKNDVWIWDKDCPATAPAQIAINEIERFLKVPRSSSIPRNAERWN